MRCRRAQERLEAYLAEGEHALSVPERERLEAHLKGCSECRHELSTLRRLRELLADMPTPAVPEGFAGRVVARAKALQREAAPRQAPVRPEWRAWRRLRLAPGTAVALAVGLALGAYLGNDVWHDDARQWQASEAQQADALTGAGFGRLVVDYDDSLAQAYLDLTSDRDG